MSHANMVALRIVLIAAGAFIAFTGVNLAFGGITTLGWQGEREFLTVANEHAFLVQDSRRKGRWRRKLPQHRRSRRGNYRHARSALHL